MAGIFLYPLYAFWPPIYFHRHIFPGSARVISAGEAGTFAPFIGPIMKHERLPGLPSVGQTGLRASMLSVPAAARTAELTAKQLFMLFPTPMFTGMLSDIGMCDRIEKKLRELQKSGKGTPSHDGMILAYMTPDDLQTLPEMGELVDVIMAEAGTILDAYAIKRDSHYITNMWANIANPNRRHNFHNHPNCLLSGIVYIKVPKNCGRTIFASSRLNSKNIEPTYLHKNDINADIFSMPPEKGRMMIWPSHVPHAVEEGTANEAEDRIVLAFNVMIRGLIEQPTARWHLG